MKKVYKNLLIMMFAILFANNLFAQFGFDAITFWVGTGSNQAMLVVDFNDSSTTECYAWGYRFDGTKTGEEMLNDIAAADTNFVIDISGGFLNSISYKEHSGLPGAPDYWMTFSGTSLSDWTMNSGISTELTNNDWFGCSYTGVDSLWNPLFVPENPVSASALGIKDISQSIEFSIFPNPANQILNISFDKLSDAQIIITNIYGQVVYSELVSQATGLIEIKTGNLKSDMYELEIITKDITKSKKFVKL